MNTKAFSVFLIVSLAVAAIVVLVYAKKNPNPYFRPRKGEVFMMSLLMIFLSVTASFIASQAFNQDFDLQKAKEKAEEEKKIMHSSGGSGETPSTGDSSSPAPVVDDTLPPFMQDEK